MRDIFFRLPPLVASILLSIGLLAISYLVGRILGDHGIDAVTFTMSLALGIDFFVLMRSRSGATRFGTPLTRSLVLSLLLVILAAVVTLAYPDREKFWINLAVAFGASIPGFLAITRGQTFPVERE